MRDIDHQLLEPLVKLLVLFDELILSLKAPRNELSETEHLILGF